MEEHGDCVVLQWLLPAEHGFGPLYLTAGEWKESRTHGLNPYADVGIGWGI
jgi:hypothetical protein